MTSPETRKRKRDASEEKAKHYDADDERSNLAFSVEEGKLFAVFAPKTSSAASCETDDEIEQEPPAKRRKVVRRAATRPPPAPLTPSVSTDEEADAVAATTSNATPLDKQLDDFMHDAYLARSTRRWATSPPRASRSAAISASGPFPAPKKVSLASRGRVPRARSKLEEELAEEAMEEKEAQKNSSRARLRSQQPPPIPDIIISDDDEPIAVANTATVPLEGPSPGCRTLSLGPQPKASGVALSSSAPDNMDVETRDQDIRVGSKPPEELKWEDLDLDDHIVIDDDFCEDEDEEVAGGEKDEALDIEFREASSETDRAKEAKAAKKGAKARREQARRPGTKDEKELALAVHNLHVVANISHYQLLSQASDDPLLQCVLLSLVPTEILELFEKLGGRNDRFGERISEDDLKRILRRLAILFHALFDGFITADSSAPHQAVSEGMGRLGNKWRPHRWIAICQQAGNPQITTFRPFYKLAPAEAVSIFVSMCRAIGLPTRLVVAVHPISCKPQMTVSEPAKTNERRQRELKKLAQAKPLHPLQLQNSNTEDDNMDGDDQVYEEDREEEEERQKKLAELNSFQFHQELANEGVVQEHPTQSTQSSQVVKRAMARAAQESTGPTLRPSAAASQPPPCAWVEVYCEEASKWIQIDPIRVIIDQPLKMNPMTLKQWLEKEAKALRLRAKGAETAGPRTSPISANHPTSANQTSPDRFKDGDTDPLFLSYVLAFEGGYVRDVMRRYSASWPLSMRLVGSPQWLAETLKAFRPVADPHALRRCELEDKEFEAAIGEEPIPTNADSLRGHPLYVWEPHVTKFEIIWPEDSVEVGVYKRKKVFRRHLLHKLHTRERWLADGLQIKTTELPVRIRTKTVPCKKAGKSALDSLAGDDEVFEKTSEYFGDWQTEPYDPPAVIGGKIPVNRFNNVYMFRPFMVPIGAVHLREPGIESLVKTMGVEYRPALVGWKQVGPSAKPMISGVVVLETDAPRILKAWKKEAEAKEQVEREKKKNKAVKNWKRVVSRLLILHSTKQALLRRNKQIPTELRDAMEVDSAGLTGGPSQESLHEHFYPRESWIYNAEGDKYTKVCSVCGQRVEFELICATPGPSDPTGSKSNV